MLIDIKLHGILGEEVGSNWKLKVKSIFEALHAINVLSKNKLKLFFIRKSKENVVYQIAVNGRYLDNDDEEILLINHNIKTIDVIPIIEGNDFSSAFKTFNFGDTFYQVGGWISTFLIPGTTIWIKGFGPATLPGAFYLTYKPVKPPNFNYISEARRKSYLINGPSNLARENNAVPVGYGRLLIGSQVIEYTQQITDVPSDPNEILT